MDDLEAIARLRRGDTSGLEPLVRRHQVAAVRAAYLVTHDRALAEEVVQAAFLRAYERIVQFDPARPFGPWFLRSVLNDASKAAARANRLRSLDTLASDDEDGVAFLTADPSPGPDALLEKAESAAEVVAALAQLTPRERAAVVQRYFLERSEAEMATALSCPPGTVKRRLHAARTRLRTLLRPLHPGTEP